MENVGSATVCVQLPSRRCEGAQDWQTRPHVGLPVVNEWAQTIHESCGLVPWKLSNLGSRRFSRMEAVAGGSCELIGASRWFRSAAPALPPQRNCWNSDCFVRVGSHCSCHTAGPFLTHVRSPGRTRSGTAIPSSLFRQHLRRRCESLLLPDPFFLAVVPLQPSVSQALRGNVQYNTERLPVRLVSVQTVAAQGAPFDPGEVQHLTGWAGRGAPNAKARRDRQAVGFCLAEARLRRPKDARGSRLAGAK